MKKYFVILIGLLLITGLIVGCSGNPQATFEGKLLADKHYDGLAYDTEEYTIALNDGTLYTFKGRGGWPLALNQTYIFKLEHIENKEFVVKSIEQK